MLDNNSDKYMWCEGCGNNKSQCRCRKDNIETVLQVICVIIVFVACFITIIYNFHK